MNIYKQDQLQQYQFFLFNFICWKYQICSNKNYTVYIVNIVQEKRTKQKRFKGFKDGESNVDDESCSGRPVYFNNDVLKSVADSQLTVVQITESRNSISLPEGDRYLILESGKVVSEAC